MTSCAVREDCADGADVFGHKPGAMTTLENRYIGEDSY